MRTLRECITAAHKEHRGIGHFNISTADAMWAVFLSAQKLSLPVIIGVSEGERDFIGLQQAVALVKSVREQYDYPIFINADHTYSYERVKEAIDAGVDSVIFDGTKLSFEENIETTKKCVEYARGAGRDVLVEGELGYIGQSSKILDAIPDGVDLTEAALTKPEQAREFVERTGVDMLAPAVGNIHGMLKGGVDPRLNIERVKEISEATGIPLVLHGGSGNSDDDFRAAVTAGVSVVHINTELRVAWKKGLEACLLSHPEEVAPYKILAQSVTEMQKVAFEKLRVFNNIQY